MTSRRRHPSPGLVPVETMVSVAGGVICGVPVSAATLPDGLETGLADALGDGLGEALGDALGGALGDGLGEALGGVHRSPFGIAEASLLWSAVQRTHSLPSPRGVTRSLPPTLPTTGAQPESGFWAPNAQSNWYPELSQTFVSRVTVNS